jgi:hypothetical protein
MRANIAIVGWDSSGTSAVANVLQRLGVYFGPRTVGYYSPGGRGGFGGELPELVQYCGSLSPIPETGWRTVPSENGLRNALSGLIDSRHELMAFKFPLLCVLIPEIELVFQGNVRYVFTERPVELSAKSMALRNGATFTQAQALARIQWLQRSRESSKTATEPIRVQFDELMERPLETVRALADALGIQHSDAQLDYAAGAINKALRHARSP